MTGLVRSTRPSARSVKVGGIVPGAARRRSLFQGQDRAVLRARKPWPAGGEARSVGGQHEGSLLRLFVECSISETTDRRQRIAPSASRPRALPLAPPPGDTAVRIRR